MPPLINSHTSASDAARARRKSPRGTSAVEVQEGDFGPKAAPQDVRQMHVVLVVSYGLDGSSSIGKAGP